MCAVLTWSVGGAGAQTEAPSKDEILQAMARYLGDALPRMSYLVATEDYSQKTLRATSDATVASNVGAGAKPANSHRLRSEVLVVPHPLAPARWLTFRDVIGVVGGPTTAARRVRLTKLLGEAEPDLVDLEEAHLHSEMDEVYVRARYSLAMNPFDVMLLMQPLYWPRLEFTLGPRAAEVGPDVWKLDFRERASTAPKATVQEGLVYGNTMLLADRPVNGSVWVDARTGRILQTQIGLSHIKNAEPDMTMVSATTTFRYDPDLRVALPEEMRTTWYIPQVPVLAPHGPFEVTGRAQYENFRRFATVRPQAQAPSREQLLQAMTRYLTDTMPRLASIAADENYRQKAPGLTGTRRRSQVLLVRPSAQVQDWLLFRDVLEADGTRIDNPDGRFTDLDRKQPDQARILRIAAADRDRMPGSDIPVNNPLIVMALMDETYRPRLELTVGRRDTEIGPNVWRLHFRELGLEERIQKTGNAQGSAPLLADRLARGTVWIDAPTGRILRTQLRFLRDDAQSLGVFGSDLIGESTTTFRYDQMLRMVVPVEMQTKLFDNSETPARVSYGEAEYTGFRQFGMGITPWLTAPEQGR